MIFFVDSPLIETKKQTPEETLYQESHNCHVAI